MTKYSDQLIISLAALANLPVRTIRMLGSAAIMLAWVACGRVTAYFEADLNSWDTAGGALLVGISINLIHQNLISSRCRSEKRADK